MTCAVYHGDLYHECIILCIMMCIMLCMLAHLCIHSCVLRAFISILSDGGTESSAIINGENPPIIDYSTIYSCCAHFTVMKSGEFVVDVRWRAR